MRGESRHNPHPDKISADKLVEAVKTLFQDAGSTPAASTSDNYETSRFARKVALFARKPKEAGETITAGNSSVEVHQIRRGARTIYSLNN